MPDWEITMTVARPAPERGWLKSVIIENATREMAIPMGIRDLLAWAQEDQDNPVPSKAIDYWNEVKTGGAGPVHLMEIQTAMEQWGISFGCQRYEAEEEIAERPVRPGAKPSRNGTASAKPLSFNDMLAQQLSLLQDRQKELSGERRRIQDEYEENHASIQQITSFLMLAKPAKKVRKHAARPKAGNA